MTSSERHRSMLDASRWCALSVAWAAAVGVASVVAGVAASSIALVGFGASSMLDGTASAVLVWRFRHERLGAADAGTVEWRAAVAVGVAMIGVALYVGGRAISALSDHAAPETSLLGIILSSASVLVLPVLARAKLRLAAALQSAALRGDGILSLAGSTLAAATLASLVLDAALGWWWADAVAALAISAMLTIEGARTVASAGDQRGLD
jgi:divalent metal cation (Fe/Co/Zn/Cd) transporter